MKNTFVIKGGKKLDGSIDVQGSKNATLALIAAALVTEKTCKLINVPDIEDVNKMLTVIKSLGVIVKQEKNHEIEITAEAITTKNIDYTTISEIRASIQIMGALASRIETFSIVAPGGCKIGSRSLDAHLNALSTIGCEI
jgi:UDP-N-acetylglucosamine 1-carboxyvinyltransferase